MPVRDSRPSALAACLAVLRSDVPRWFLEREEREFRAPLDAPPGPHCSGMVDHSEHGRGWGTRLLRERLRLALTGPMRGAS